MKNGKKGIKSLYLDLIDALKRSSTDALDLEIEIKSRFKEHRNLDHYLQSANFFGKEEVNILSDNPDAFRIIDCNSRIKSKTVIITFSKVSLGLEHIPFGYPFLNRLGYKHIHIAQKKGTSYQLLSEEQLCAELLDYLQPYPNRVCYGASLGGYAALYYAPSLNAHVLAGSPRLPLHPINIQFKGTKWQPGGHWDEHVYLHKDLKEVMAGQSKSALCFYDPNDEIDSAFVDDILKGKPKGFQTVSVEGAKHGAFNVLSKQGLLKGLVYSFVEMIDQGLIK